MLDFQMNFFGFSQKSRKVVIEGGGALVPPNAGQESATNAARLGARGKLEPSPNPSC